MTRSTFLLPQTLFAVVMAQLTGCESNIEPVDVSQRTSTSTTVEAQAEHDHGSAGPHQGDLVDLGNGEYHAEVLYPHDHQDSDDPPTFTIYILDSSAKESIPIKSNELTLNLVHEDKPTQFHLAASPDQSDPQEKSSRFVSSDPKLITQLGESQIKGHLIAMIGGKSYRGSLAHNHRHTGDDALVWQRTDLEHNGFQIRLGHHGTHLRASHAVEPAVSILHDGMPVSNAQVFNSLVAEDDLLVIAEEVGTVYEPPTADEPAHYAQGALAVPAGIERVVIRYRLLLPGDGGEKTFDVAVDVEL